MAALVALTVVLAAYGPSEVARDAAPADLLVTVRGGTISAPNAIAAGWTRVRVEEDGAGHIVVVFRLPATASEADIATFLAALDTAATTPHPAVAMGDVSVDTGRVMPATRFESSAT